MVKVGDLKSIHVIMVAIMAFVLYSLMSSYSSDGFCVSSQNQYDPVQIPLCCVNLYNSNIPDEIKKLRKSSPQECMTKISNYVSSNNDLKIKQDQYSKLFGCNENSLEEYCKYTDDKLYQWKDKYNPKNIISYNSSNTTDSCDFLQFLDNTTLENKKYGDQSLKKAMWWWNFSRDWMPQSNSKYSETAPLNNPKLNKKTNMCSYVINDLYTNPPASKDWGKFNSLDNLLFGGVGSEEGIPLAYCMNNKNFSSSII